MPTNKAFNSNVQYEIDNQRHHRTFWQLAFIKHRGYVVPEDVRAVVHDVMRHRIGLSYEAEASNVTSEDIVSKIINKVEVP